MKLAICIYSNDAESVWNAFRFGNYAVKHSHDEVQVSLLGKESKPSLWARNSFESRSK